MFDKALFDKICSNECTLDELKGFFDGIESREFDTDTPFDKYYRFDRVRTALEKFKSGEISCEFLRYWANAYNLILRGGFFALDEGGGDISREQLARGEISSLIDSISFFDDELSDSDSADHYLRMIKIYDSLLRGRNSFRIAYAHTCEFAEDQTDLRILIINDEEKIYAGTVRFSPCVPEEISDGEVMEEDELAVLLDSLIEQGYTQLS